MNLRNTVHAIISRGDRYFVAECLEIPVVTQGLTVDETLTNLQEAMALHLEGEDLAELDCSQPNTLGHIGAGTGKCLGLEICQATMSSP